MDKGWFRSVPSNVSGAPDMERIMAAAADVAGAMAYLHANNVLHGDLTGGDCPAALRFTALVRGMLQKMRTLNIMRLAECQAQAVACVGLQRSGCGDRYGVKILCVLCCFVWHVNLQRDSDSGPWYQGTCC